MRHKILLEGNEEQVDNIRRLLSIDSENLPKELVGMQLANLWSIKDVKINYECTDEEAMDVVEQALINEATMDQIWLAIDFHAEEAGLKDKRKVLGGNRVILDFLAAPKSKDGLYDLYGIIGIIEDGEDEKHFFHAEEVLFNKSWDWLMPVIKEISSDCEEPVEIDDLKYSVLFDDIDSAYTFVVDYIRTH